MSKALFDGTHPSYDFEGNPLPSLHAKWSGKPIAGGGLLFFVIVICFYVNTNSQPNPASLATSSLQVTRLAS